jgi:hypothetical protein
MKRAAFAYTLALSMAAGSFAASTARADDTTPMRTEETTEGSAPNSYMLSAGVVVLALSYGSASVVGPTSPRTGDRTLLVPIVGPWFDFANRPGCGTGPSCNGENTDKVLLATDGVFQAIGALSIVGAFLSPEKKEVRTVQRASLRLVPAYFGAGSSGLAAVGRF